QVGPVYSGDARRGRACAARPLRVSCSDERAEDVLEDSAIAVVVRFSGGGDAHDGIELDGLLALGRELAPLRRDRDGLARRAFVQLLESRDRDDLGTVEPQGLPAFPGGELQGNDTHTDEVGAVDALEALGDDRLDAEEARALGRPVARRPRAVLLAAEDDQG